VLIHGENGSGRSWWPDAIHVQSTRRERSSSKSTAPLSREELIESRAGRHEKGAFTGALAAAPRKVSELADGGTLFTGRESAT